MDRTLAALLWVLAGASLIAGGCGSSSSPESPEGSMAQSSGFEMDIQNCAGFGTADAAELLGVAASALVDKSQAITEESHWCIFSNPENREQGVMFTLSRADSEDDAITEFQQFRGNVGVAVGALGEAGDRAHNIPNLGDEALWTPVPGGVYLRKGRYSVQVNSPGDEQMQIKIAKRLIGEE
jgi:hypothetical protein